MKDRRSRAVQNSVNLAALGKISDLSRSAKITGGWKQVILHHRSQNDARAETHGFTLSNPGQLVQSEFTRSVFCVKGSVRAFLKRIACIIVCLPKKGKIILAYQHLRMEAVGDKLIASRPERIDDLARSADRLCVN